MAITQVSPKNLQQQLQEDPQAYFLLDVREPFEYQIASLEDSVLIPMNQIPARLDELDKEQAIVVICHHGMRSENVAYFLDQQGYNKVFNLTGGIDAWARSCDSEMALY
ncbi:rhodanese-like domain-containing protein [Methyloprofundus sp.]|uniref:rhodanese-like domain-containing protein n=1 Tax=Methyloprofundus sp. TaxID=2020875 RepID=UPI003D120DF0